MLPAQIPAAAWFGIAGVGIVSTFIAVQAFYAGAHRIGAARASLVSTVEPIWTIVAREPPLPGVARAAPAASAGRMILVGVVIAQTGGERATAPELRLADRAIE